MKPFFFILVSLLSIQAGAQDKVIMNDKNVVLRDMGPFNGINIKGPFKVYYSQGTKHAVGVSATSESARDRINTRVSAGMLYVELEGVGMNWWGKNQEFKVYISSPEVKRIHATGAVNFLVTDLIKTDELNLKFTGASDFSGKLDCSSLILNFTGASDVEIIGSANKLVADLTGASKLSGASFKVSDAALKATGASTIKISVSGELGANASGASSITYYGSPKSIVSKASGASSVKKGN